MKLTTIFIFFFSIKAFSSQCVDLKYNQASKALKIVNNSKINKEFYVLDKYCESCLDTYPKPILLNDIEIDSSDSISHILINGKVEDLAYIYVDGENLAQKVNCRTIAVSKFSD